MKTKIFQPSQHIKPSEITSKAYYQQRRQIIKSLALLPAACLPLPSLAATEAMTSTPHPKHTLDARGYEAITPKEKGLSYNNFYELGTSKEEPSSNSDFYEPDGEWRVRIEGEVSQPQEFNIDDLRALAPMEERVYRLRCVEAWSMVIPWIGFSLSHLIEAVKPTSNAKYVQFLTFDPNVLFPDQANQSLPWPYSEGLRIDEAMHPLTLLTFGMYGESLTTQNGSPVRMIIPWKYGFKSGKALEVIRFTEERPETTWNILQASEYGFFANVNPEVSHPRWSQSSERTITDSFFPSRRETDMFNGYPEVASLYSDMDLSLNF